MDHVYKHFTGGGDDATILQYLEDHVDPPKTIIIDNVQFLSKQERNSLEIFMKSLINYGKIILCSSSVFVRFQIMPDQRGLTNKLHINYMNITEFQNFVQDKAISEDKTSAFKNLTDSSKLEDL